MHISTYLGLIKQGELQLAESFTVVSTRHLNEPEVREQCKQFAGWSSSHVEALAPFLKRYGEEPTQAPEMLRGVLFGGARIGGLGKLRDLQDLGVLANTVRTNYTILMEGAAAVKDGELKELCERLGQETNRQIDWTCTQIKTAAPQALTVEADKLSELKASLPNKPTVAAIPDTLWSPLVGAILMAVVGLLSVLVGQPWLFPSLGPTAYLQAESPALHRSKPYNIVLGHAVGVVAGFAAVFLFMAYNDPVVLTDKTITLGRALAAALALALTIGGAYLLRASHPPAGATTLLVALGSIKTLEDVLHLAIGVILIVLVGEVLRRVRVAMAPPATDIAAETAGR